MEYPSIEKCSLFFFFVLFCHIELSKEVFVNALGTTRKP
jgi:hypothetical protein